MNALQKLGAGEKEERLLALLERTTSEQERSCVLEALAKLGGEASLKALDNFGIQAKGARQRILACLARKSGYGELVFDRYFCKEDLLGALKIHLRCRRGLEKVLCEEVKEDESHGAYFVVKDLRPGLVTLDVKRTFSLKQILAWRCWQSVGFVVGKVPDWDKSGGEERIARLICSELASEITRSFTQGIAIYRLELIGRGARRGFVKEVVRHASITSSE
jgi:hypothetical protein